MAKISATSATGLEGVMPHAFDPSTTESCIVRAPAIPKISAFAGLQRYRNDRVGILAELGDERIDIVESRFGPLRLVFITEAELARKVLVEHNDSLRKGPAISRHAGPLLGNGLLSSHGADHRAQRKVLAPKFTPRQIAGYAQTMVDLTEAMIARWQSSPPVCFDEEVTALTMTIAARTMFGTDISTADIDALSTGVSIANHWFIEQSTSFLPLPLWVPTPRNLQMRKVLRAMDSVVYRMIAEHRSKGIEGDVLAALLAARDDNDVGMSDQLIRDQVITFFIAGHETISSTLGWMYRLLRERPDVAERIAAEAEQVLGARTNEKASDAQSGIAANARKLVYTRAAVQEIMRLRPGAYMIGRQALADIIVGGYRIQAGSYIAVNTLGLHRRADYFEDPLAFRCERFMTEPAWPRAAYQPFGAGPRVCIGNHFAMMEATLVLALICRAARFDTSDTREFAGGSGSSNGRVEFDANPLITLRPKNRIPFDLTWRTA